jgi:predicted nicotinamide N-methyase
VLKKVQEWYAREQRTNQDIPFPFWAQVWPSSIALAGFIENNRQYVKDKNVTELAAGLGLPSIVAARYARQVLASDFAAASMQVLQQTVCFLGLYDRVKVMVQDWSQLPENFKADTILISDINYDPAVFDQLFIVLQRLLANGCTIVLTTPQRLMAKPFIERLLPYSSHQETIPVLCCGDTVDISLLVLTPQVEG